MFGLIEIATSLALLAMTVDRLEIANPRIEYGLAMTKWVLVRVVPCLPRAGGGGNMNPAWAQTRKAGGQMAIYRLYAGNDGQSHIEETSLANHPELTEDQAARSIFFREWPPGHFIDWHPAPRRQYIISLGGEIEIGLGDGTTVRYGPGDARLVEDTSGQGHTTRVVGDQPSLTAVIPLAD